MTGEPLNNREVNHIFDKLDQIDSKLDTHIAENVEQTTTLSQIKGLAEKTNGRVTKLELWKSKVIGYGLGVAGLFSVIVTMVRLL